MVRNPRGEENKDALGTIGDFEIDSADGRNDHKRDVVSRSEDGGIVRPDLPKQLAFTEWKCEESGVARLVCGVPVLGNPVCANNWADAGSG